MTERMAADPSEVRDLVRRIVDGVLGDGAVGADDTVAAGVPAPPKPDRSEPGSLRIAVGADHGGYPLKEHLAFMLREAGHHVIDCGTGSGESVDYPEFAHAVARQVAGGDADYGVIVDGAGIGSAMVANKVPGIRAALAYDISTARNSREHNHANVLTLGAGLIGKGLAWQIVEEWLAVPWGEGRHARRVGMISEIERQYLRKA